MDSSIVHCKCARFCKIITKEEEKAMMLSITNETLKVKCGTVERFRGSVCEKGAFSDYCIKIVYHLKIIAFTNLVRVRHSWKRRTRNMIHSHAVIVAFSEIAFIATCCFNSLFRKRKIFKKNFHIYTRLFSLKSIFHRTTLNI